MLKKIYNVCVEIATMLKQPWNAWQERRIEEQEFFARIKNIEECRIGPRGSC